MVVLGMFKVAEAENKKGNTSEFGKWMKLCGLDMVTRLGLNGLTALPIKLVSSKVKDDAGAVKKLMSLGKSTGALVSDAIEPHTDSSNAFYKTIAKTISASPDLENKAGIIGHELGHAMNAASSNKIVNWISKLRDTPSLQYAPAAAGVVNGMLYKNLTTKQMLGVDALGTVAYSPWLLEELSASLRGYNAARKAGAGRLASAAAFSGLPSYLANASLPWLQTLMQHKLGLTKNTLDK